jgi:hypothetical protein
MHFASQSRSFVRIHSTNILGLGSVRLIQSLLPAFITHPKYFIEKVYLPLNGEISNLKEISSMFQILLCKQKQCEFH